MATKWIRNTDVVCEELDGHALLVHSATGARWTLNATALSLWKLCDGTRTMQALANALNISARRDELERFTRALCGSGMLLGSGMADELASVPTAHFSVGSMLHADYLGKNLGGPRLRPSPRGNSGPG